MNWGTLIGSEITVDGQLMKVTDYCKTCRKIWAETKHEQFYLGVNKNGDIHVKSKILKRLK